ncbi:hypothetical protein AAFF_G00336010 [Aldrovandia affinis]|uniref:Uncharacterized protein n=1 Tax=Aldrovandia affinis TaxID=143900 RepID=A0AAD7SLK9_9TELE|nr:hypothetical protein AAFF_G00336010 [Aldrovandia affinis]
MVTIIMNKSLHQPMYCLLFNLPINDLIGSSALFPQLIKEILLDTRHIESTELTKNTGSNKVRWTPKCNSAFCDLKGALCGESLLLNPDFDPAF